MVCYYDTSFLISALLEQTVPGDIDQLWDGATDRLSSLLLRFESIVAIRRAAESQGLSDPTQWVDERLSQLEGYFQSISFVRIDESIERVLRGEPRLAQCRSLDAIHLATALYIAPNTIEPLTVCTLDHRMAALARELGLRVEPE